MEATARHRTPMHLWIVGGLATLWNAFGAYDYVMTRTRNTDYLASMMPGAEPEAVLAWVDSFPLWAQFGWGLGVWMGLLGAVLLLIQSRFAVHAFALSLIGMVLSFGHQFLGAAPVPGGDESTMALAPIAIIVVGIALLFYAMKQRRNGVLR